MSTQNSLGYTRRLQSLLEKLNSTMDEINILYQQENFVGEHVTYTHDVIKKRSALLKKQLVNRENFSIDLPSIGSDNKQGEESKLKDSKPKDSKPEDSKPEDSKPEESSFSKPGEKNQFGAKTSFTS